MRAPHARLSARRPIVIEQKALDYLAAIAARANGPKPCDQPFPFYDHRTVAEVDAEVGDAALSRLPEPNTQGALL